MPAGRNSGVCGTSTRLWRSWLRQLERQVALRMDRYMGPHTEVWSVGPYLSSTSLIEVGHTLGSHISAIRGMCFPYRTGLIARSVIEVTSPIVHQLPTCQVNLVGWLHRCCSYAALARGACYWWADIDVSILSCTNSVGPYDTSTFTYWEDVLLTIGGWRGMGPRTAAAPACTHHSPTAGPLSRNGQPGTYGA